MMGACPEWYAWARAAQWLNTDALAMEGHEDGVIWYYRALAAMDAEKRAEEHHAKRQQARR